MPRYSLNTAIIGIKPQSIDEMILTNIFLYFQRYFLGRARKLCSLTADHVPATLQWLCHPEGHRFFVDHKWHIGGKESLYTSLCDQGS